MFVRVTSVKKGIVHGLTYEIHPERIRIPIENVQPLKARPVTVVEKPASKKSRWITTKRVKVTFHKQPKNR